MLKPALLSLLALAAVPAAAQDRPVAPTARVRIADLNLAAPAGVTEFDRRLKVAVRRLCPNYSFAPDLSRMALHARCVRDASRSAAAQREIALARVGTGWTKIAAAR